jgi:hypothetical protein
MTASYNGFKASPNPADFGGLDNSFVPGTSIQLRPGVRAGVVAEVLHYVAAQLDKRVEDGDLYEPGDDWGYSYRPSKNSASLLSCHSSGTAFDWNATRHPNGRRGTFNAAQVSEIRKILAEVDGAVYWGGDGWDGGTVDEMHFEIATGTTLEKLAEVAAKIKAKPPVPPKAPAPAWQRVALGSRVLSRGARGTDVSGLQTIMVRRYPAYAKTLVVDGIFGAGTERVIREFQKRAGLTVDGIAGRKTFRALGI